MSPPRSFFRSLIIASFLFAVGTAASPLDNWHWRNPLPQGNTLRAVACAENTFVAVGQVGAIITSPDGIRWTVHSSGTTTGFYGIAYGNNTFVAVGTSGTIMTSVNGIAWTPRDSGTSQLLYSITYANGIFVVVGGAVILTSTDGVTWTRQSFAAFSPYLVSITYGNNVFVAVGGADHLYVLTSPDGIVWTSRAFGSGPLSAVTYGDGIFVAVGSSGTILTSSDTITWTRRSEPTGSLTAVAFGSGTFVATSAGVFDSIKGWSGWIITSPDGNIWTRHATAASQHQPIDALAYGKGTFVGVGNYGMILTSANGSSWIPRTSEFSDILYDVAFGNQTFVAVGEHGTVLASSFGTLWSSYSSGVDANLFEVAFDQNVFVAVGSRPAAVPFGTIITSPDGFTWTSRTSYIPGTISAVTSGENLFAAVGAGGTIITSPDGATWTTRLSGSGTIDEIAYGNGIFFALDSQGRVITSDDGISWVIRNSIFSSRVDDIVPGDNNFVVATTGGMRIVSSHDGAVWTSRVVANSGPAVTRIFGTFLGYVSGGLRTSNDAETWTTRFSTTTALRGFCYGNGTCVAVGNGGAILQSDPFPINLERITINGDSTIQAGDSKPYQCIAHFSDGTTKDVSTEATWSVLSSKPESTLFLGTSLQAGHTESSFPIQIQASFADASGRRTSEPFAVTVQPRFTVLLLYNTSFVEPSTMQSVDFSTLSWGPNGPAETYTWDLDGDGFFDDATGNATIAQFQVPGTVRIGVEARDNNGLVDVSKMPLTFDRSWHVAASTPHTSAPDPIDGALYDLAGNRIYHLDPAGRRGLVVIIHGICAAADSTWVQAMASAIRLRLFSTPPNIVLYNWDDTADLLHPCPLFLSVYGALSKLNGKREQALVHGIKLAQWIQQEATDGRLNLAEPIHLIGHSAGGVIAGEAAQNLPDAIVQVTMLDTPFPFASHFRNLGPNRKVERYITSIFAQAAKGSPKNYAPELEYRKPLNPYVACVGCVSAGELVSKLSTGDYYHRETIGSDSFAHSKAHEWYTDSISDAPINGFDFSPLLNNRFHTPPAGATLPLFAPRLLDQSQQEITGFLIVGNVESSTNTYRLSEGFDAGILKTLTLPIAASDIRFRYKFEIPGDGDFLTVHWGTNYPSYVGPDVPLTQTRFMEVTIPVSDFAGQTGTLLFKLVSRGQTNAVLLLDQIRLSLASDSDSDGLSNDQEAALATSPLSIDSDGDGLTDFDEATIFQTNPTLADTDGDGTNDAREIVAGTNPIDNSSSLRITGVCLTSSNSIQIDWSGTTNTLYRVNRSAFPSRANYSTLTNGLPGQPVTTFTDNTATNGTAFYWIEAQ